MRREDYDALGGHMEHIKDVSSVLTSEVRKVEPVATQPDPHQAQRNKREGRG